MKHFVCLTLDEWTALKLRPPTSNIVTKAVKSVIPALKHYLELHINTSLSLWPY